MHPNPDFRKIPDNENLAFARERAFGTLSINAEPAPLLAHIPFVLNDAGTFVDLHLVRSNPIIRLLKQPMPAVISILGPDSYISPDWYGVQNQVPTWNYIAVHLRGTLSLLPQSDLEGILERLSNQFETRLAPKPIWTRAKMDQELLTKRMRMIVPLRLQIDDIQGTWKLAQNKPDSARIGSADAVATDGIGHETSTLAKYMRNPPNS